MERDEALKVLSDALDDPALADKHARIRSVLSKAGRPTSFAEQQARAHAPTEGASLEQKFQGASHENDPESEGDRSLQTFNRGADALWHTIRHPIDTATSPSRRRQTLRGIDDMTTLGWGQELSDRVVKAARNRANVPLPPGEREEYVQSAAPTLGEQAQRDEELAPGQRMVGQGMGMGLPGATSYVSKLGSDAASRGLLRVPAVARAAVRGGPAVGAAIGAARALGGYELAAPAMAAGRAGSEDRAGAAKEAAADPLGILLSGTVGAGGGAGRGEANSIRDPRKLSGRVIADVDAAGGRITKFGERPIKEGLFDSPELQSLPLGRQGTNQLAAASAERIGTKINPQRLRAARQEFGDAIDDVIMSHGNQPHPTTNAHAALDALEAENTVKAGRPDAEIGDDGVHNAIWKVRRMLTQANGQVDEAATLANMMKKLGIPSSRNLTPQAQKSLVKQALAIPNNPAIAYRSAKQITAEDMVKTRKLVRQMANNAATPTENRVFEKALGAMDDDAASIDPRIAEMNAKFHKAMVPIETSNDMLFGKPRKEVDFTEAERTTGTTRMGQIGDETQAGTVRRVGDRLSAVGPEYKREVDLMRAKKAEELLRRGEPEVSTALEKAVSRPKGRYTGTMVGAMVHPAIGIPIGFGIDKLRESPLANKVRLGLPAADTIGKATGRSGVGIEAIAARRRGKKKRSQGAEMNHEDGRP